MLYPFFKIALVGFRPVNFSLRSLISCLAKPVSQNQPPAHKEKAEDSVGLDFKLKDLIRFGKVLELSLIPDFSRVAHAAKEGGEFLLYRHQELFEPLLRRSVTVWRDIEFKFENMAIVNKTRQRIAMRPSHSTLRRTIAYMLLREQAEAWTARGEGWPAGRTHDLFRDGDGQAKAESV